MRELSGRVGWRLVSVQGLCGFLFAQDLSFVLRGSRKSCVCIAPEMSICMQIII